MWYTKEDLNTYKPYPLCDLHTHTIFCDGKDTQEAMVQAAIAKGFDVLGFSGHSYAPFDLPCCMKQEEIAAYRQGIEELDRAYKGQIKLMCGIEQDFYSPEPAVGKGYDYIIGSVHYLYVNGCYLPIDLSRSSLQNTANEHFGGDFYRLIRCYYETLSQIKSKTGCDIVGHLDLVEKFNEGDALFSTDDYRYRRALVDAIDALLEQNVIFEINTGAVSRGYRRLPYPSPYALRRIAEKRGRVMINSDAHRKENIGAEFHTALRTAISGGIGGLTVPGIAGWETVSVSHFLKRM